jgi:stearoyl-CoA desaturase (delta-9 desaturase)
MAERMISLEEFNQMVHQQKAVVVLDDLVLDVSCYLDEHPGGRFLLEQNLGRDISKFFYGGFTTENINKVKPYNHSLDARKAVNRLSIGRLVEKVPKRLMVIDRCE